MPSETIRPALVKPDVALEVKIGQMLMLGFRGTTAQQDPAIVRALTEQHVGGVVLFDGPRLLLAGAAEQRPVLVLAVDDQGRPLLTDGKNGAYSVATVSHLEVEAKEAAEALRGTARIGLATWDQTPRDAPAVFVFDVITVPSSSGLEAVEQK